MGKGNKKSGFQLLLEQTYEAKRGTYRRMAEAVPEVKTLWDSMDETQKKV